MVRSNPSSRNRPLADEDEDDSELEARDVAFEERDQEEETLTFDASVDRIKGRIISTIDALAATLDRSLDPNDGQKRAMLLGLRAALDIVTGSRNKCYGAPKDNHGCTAEIWSSYLRRRGLMPKGAEMDGRDVCWLMNGLKMSRDAHWRQEDNIVDAIGYSANALACSVDA